MKKIGYLMFSVSIAFIIGAIVNVFLAKKKEANYIINVGLIWVLFGFIAILINTLLFSRLISISSLLFVAIVMFGIGVLMPAAKAGAMTSRDRYVGTAASLMKFIQSMGCVVVTKIASYYINHQNINGLIIMLFIVVLIPVIFTLIIPASKNYFGKARAGQA